jgi:hypothetical protein
MFSAFFSSVNRTRCENECEMIKISTVTTGCHQNRSRKGGVFLLKNSYKHLDSTFEMSNISSRLLMMSKV